MPGTRVVGGIPWLPCANDPIICAGLTTRCAEIANSQQGEYEQGNEDAEVKNGSCVSGRERLSDPNLVQVDSCRPEKKDAPANRGRSPKAAAIPQTEDSQNPERQVGYGNLVLERVPRRPANRRRNWNGSHRMPGKAYQSAEPDGKREEVEQQHVGDSLSRARLLVNRNGKNTENQADCGEDDKYHGLPPFPLKVITRALPAVFRIARITLVGVFRLW
jgi:hypothetical protein